MKNFKVKITFKPKFNTIYRNIKASNFEHVCQIATVQFNSWIKSGHDVKLWNDDATKH